MIGVVGRTVAVVLKKFPRREDRIVVIPEALKEYMRCDLLK